MECISNEEMPRQFGGIYSFGGQKGRVRRRTPSAPQTPEVSKPRVPQVRSGLPGRPVGRCAPSLIPSGWSHGLEINPAGEREHSVGQGWESDCSLQAVQDVFVCSSSARVNHSAVRQSSSAPECPLGFPGISHGPWALHTGHSGFSWGRRRAAFPLGRMQNREASLSGYGASEEGLRVWGQARTEASQVQK